MKVHYGFDTLPKIERPILTIGTYDGVHQGHQQILNRIKSVAKEVKGQTVLFTFHPHPRVVLGNDKDLKLLQTQEEKISKLERLGLDHLIIYPFTASFANTKAEEFIKKYLVDKLNVHTIVVGYDHQFGANRAGSLEHLIQLAPILNFNVIEIPAHEVDDVNVSSTKIRNAILEGNITLANEFLNEAYCVSGEVVSGNKLGRKIGFPTANILLEEAYKLIPPIGVYAVEVEHEEDRYFGMLNIGIKPTVSNEKKLSVEVHIFDFDKQIYGDNLMLYLHQFIRKEQAFNGVEQLIEQLKKDELEVRTYFSLV